MEFSNKTAIVTGAASGMGLLFSKRFADEGGRVVMVDINADALKTAADDIEKTHPGMTLTSVCDVRHYDEICKVCEDAVKHFGTIDVMINFAGGAAVRILGVPGDVEFPDVPIEVYDWGIDVNLKAQFYFDHVVMKYMREQRSGVIINIGSVTGAEGCAKSIDYSAAKSGVMIGLTKSVALYGAQYGVRCVCVSPGPVLTRPGMASMKTALGRAAKPEEIIDACLFLASDKSAFTTGVNILIDGGRVITRDRT